MSFPNHIYWLTTRDRVEYTGPMSVLRPGSLLLAVIAGTLLASRCWGEKARTVTVMQWNVENLFDTVDDPANKGDDPFTARGWEHWTDERYQAKLANLARVIETNAPDLICLEEIENRRVLDDLRGVLKTTYGRDYPYVIHREGSDHRGIDVAILSAIPAASPRWLTPVPEQRDILSADFDVEGQRITLIVNHWKSRLGPKDEADQMRASEAAAARVEVDRLLAANSNAAVMLIGDFNDDCDGSALRDRARSLLDMQAVLADPTGMTLYNLQGGLPAGQRGTIYFAKGKTWNSFDSISVSRSMIDPARQALPGWRALTNSFAIVNTDWMRDASGAPKPFRRVNPDHKAHGTYSFGFSDHFPVRVTLELNGGPAPPIAGP